MQLPEGEVIKWGGGFIAAVLAFFTLKKMVSAEVESTLLLHIDLLHAEARLIEEKNKQTKLEVDRLSAAIALKLSEKEHSLICDSMKAEIESIKDCIKHEIKLLYKFIGSRKDDGDNN